MEREKREKEHEVCIQASSMSTEIITVHLGFISGSFLLLTSASPPHAARGHYSPTGNRAQDGNTVVQSMRHETAPEGAANLLIPVRFRMEQPLESQGLAATGVAEDINSGTLDRRPCTRMTTRFHGHTGPTDRVNREIEIVSALLDSSNRYHEVPKNLRERERERDSQHCSSKKV